MKMRLGRQVQKMQPLLNHQPRSTIGVAVTLMIIGVAGLLEARAGADEEEEAEVGLDLS